MTTTSGDESTHDTVAIHCSMPPSANRLWRHGNGRHYLDPKYQAWLREFSGLIMAMRPRPRIKGRFHIVITLDGLRSNADLDNRVKPVLDALQRSGVIEDDKLAESVTVTRGWAPDGCNIGLTPVIYSLHKIGGAS